MFDTAYGRVAVVICADMFYPHFPRAAAVAGAQVLLAPANVGISTGFMRVRTFENGFAMVVANRYGTGTSGTERDYFNQETFTIASPFPYEFKGARSVIVDADGNVLADVSGDATQIGYGELPLGPKRPFPVVRKPSSYSLIAHDTMEPYVRTNLGLPDEGVFVAAAIDPGPSPTPAKAAARAVEAAHTRASEGGDDMRLAVLPEAYLESVEEKDLEAFKVLSARYENGHPRKRIGRPSSRVRPRRARRQHLQLSQNPQTPNERDTRFGVVRRLLGGGPGLRAGGDLPGRGHARARDDPRAREDGGRRDRGQRRRQLHGAR